MIHLQRRSVRIGLLCAFALALLLIAIAFPSAAAQEQPTHRFYGLKGDVTIDGKPLQPGDVIVAWFNDKEIGRAVVGADGRWVIDVNAEMFPNACDVRFTVQGFGDNVSWTNCNLRVKLAFSTPKSEDSPGAKDSEDEPKSEDETVDGDGTTDDDPKSEEDLKDGEEEDPTNKSLNPSSSPDADEDDSYEPTESETVESTKPADGETDTTTAQDVQRVQSDSTTVTPGVPRSGTGGLNTGQSVPTWSIGAGVAVLLSIATLTVWRMAGRRRRSRP